MSTMAISLLFQSWWVGFSQLKNAKECAAGNSNKNYYCCCNWWPHYSNQHVCSQMMEQRLILKLDLICITHCNTKVCGSKNTACFSLKMCIWHLLVWSKNIMKLNSKAHTWKQTLFPKQCWSWLQCGQVWLTGHACSATSKLIMMTLWENTLMIFSVCDESICYRWTSSTSIKWESSLTRVHHLEFLDTLVEDWQSISMFLWVILFWIFFHF